MRPNGRAEVNSNRPRALGVCDRCYKRYNHDVLRWQFQWVATKLQNLHLLVCPSCMDEPQEQLRTIILPPDPVPILNARPENEVSNNNPMSGIGGNPAPRLWRYSSRIGNLTLGGGVDAAFDGTINKPFEFCAINSVSNSSFNNYVGINWGGDTSGITTPSSLMAPVVRHSLISFAAYAPNDRSFLGTEPTDYVVQSSPNAVSWTTISSGTTAGTPGETISGECTGGLYQFHRLAFEGDGVHPVSVAQVEFYVAQIGTVATAGSS